MPLTDLEKKINKLIAIDFEVATQNAIIEGEGVLIEMIQSQLAAGKTGDDTPILLDGVGEYSPSYKRFKNEFGRQTDFIDLYMFGSFYERIFVNVKAGKFSVLSDVPYFDKIIIRSGTNIMKLSQANYESFYQLYIEPAINKEISKMFEE